MAVKHLSLAQIAELTGGSVKGDPNYVVESVSAMENYKEHSISPLWENKFLQSVKPGMVLITKPGWIAEGGAGIEVDDPRRALIPLLLFFDPHVPERQGIHPSASVSAAAIIGGDVHIGANCVVSDEAVIGDGCVLTGNIWIGRGVSIGAGT